MDGDLYDEFGNYIGPDLESDSDDDQSVYGQDNRDADEDAMEEDEDADAEPEAAPMSVVLHEDKRYVKIICQYFFRKVIKIHMKEGMFLLCHLVYLSMLQLISKKI